MITLREAAQQALEALEICAVRQEHQWHGLQQVQIVKAALRAALEQPEQCACGDRPKDKCPGEWEPGCDLGNNPKYARRVPLEQPEQEPVAWRWKAMVNGDFVSNWVLTHSEPPPYALESHPLYTHPPRREWRSLSEDKVEYPHPPAKPPVYATSQNTKAVRDGFVMGGYEKEPGYYSEEQLDEFARAIEAALKERNA